jgi:hypothetical protein
MEREKERERITILCEYERESCPKVVKKWLSKYHFSKMFSAKSALWGPLNGRYVGLHAVTSIEHLK